jgi:four helix bundle protein
VSNSLGIAVSSSPPTATIADRLRLRPADGGGLNPEVNMKTATTFPDHMYFDFERLDVYRLSREHLQKVARLTILPRLRDQLDRAADSILLNIAEGMGKPSGSKDRRKSFRIALGSAKECACAWELLCIRRRVVQGAAKQARGLLLRIVAMLTRMAS